MTYVRRHERIDRSIRFYSLERLFLRHVKMRPILFPLFSGASDSMSPPAGCDSSSVASPWPRTSVSPASGGLSHRAKSSKPKRLSLSKLPLETRNALSFGMKPPPCIVPLRKKVRGVKRRRRVPFDPIKVGDFLLRLEEQAVKTRARRKPFQADRIKQSSRLESCVSKVKLMPVKKKTHIPLVPIASWNNSGKSNVKRNNGSTIAGPPPPAPPVHIQTATVSCGVSRINSDFFTVT